MKIKQQKKKIPKKKPLFIPWYIPPFSQLARSAEYPSLFPPVCSHLVEIISKN